ncbi:MAG: adenosylcobalamin-dependent ribonucleoside-diphosphate reductase [Nitrospirae bacterium]|nr:adenosylcobalamin-dependent ribonucleoside-diphosphate reductase [Nitrospirota bacterium]
MAHAAEIVEITPGKTSRPRLLSSGPEVLNRRLELSENQLKVIRDKYLRDAKSVEAWLLGVARNIALGELLHAPEIPREKVLRGVKHTIRKFEDPAGGTVDLFLLHEGLHEFDERERNFRRYMENLERLVEEEPAARPLVDTATAEFYGLLSEFYFLPNSPTLMNAGRALQQLSACYVLPVEDSIEGIFEAIKNQALIHKSGGGTGFSFGRIRPMMDEVRTTKGIASGPVSFMKIFDIATEQVKQGGTRRGANMAILPYTHPDILDFVTLKGMPGVLENFNISVGIDSKFIDAVRNDEEYDLLNPKTKKPEGHARARDVFERIIEYAWKCGDPGYVVLDRINQSHSNPTPEYGQIEATNPCGEQPLLPNEPCNLGSINLARFVRDDRTLDREGLREVVHASIHFLDNVIDLNNYPTPEIERMAKGNRRIGLGVMGFAEMLIKMGTPYNTEEAISVAEDLMKFVSETSLEASVALARTRGVFPHFKGSIYDRTSIHFRGEDVRPRNCARTTIAPTGTIAIASGLQGSGIEPFFAISYTRYNAKGLDAVKKGNTPDPKDVFFEVNPLFREVAARHDFFGLQEEVLWLKINDNHGSVLGLREIPPEIQQLFPTSHDISLEHHIRIQSAFQKHTDNAVSKTINCPNETTPEEMAKAYLLAYDLGCKGLTVYRDGSKAQQVLNLNKKDPGRASAPAPEPAPMIDRQPTAHRGTTSAYYEMQTGYGPLHVNIIYDEKGPYRIFTNLPPLGTEISGLTAVIGILLSKYLETGGDPARLLKHLNSVRGDKPYGFGASRIDSIPHALSKILRDHLMKTGKLQSNGITPQPDPPAEKAGPNSAETSPAEKEGQRASAPKANGVHLQAVDPIRQDATEDAYCPQCYSRNVQFVSGCKKPTCFDCGFSECS